MLRPNGSRIAPLRRRSGEVDSTHYILHTRYSDSSTRLGKSDSTDNNSGRHFRCRTRSIDTGARTRSLPPEREGQAIVRFLLEEHLKPTLVSAPFARRQASRLWQRATVLVTQPACRSAG